MNIVTKDFSLATKSYDIFFSGCYANPKCQDCHNPEAWDFNCGTDWKLHMHEIKENTYLFSDIIDKLFLLGGEPLDQNREEFLECVNFLKPLGKEIWLFTRFEKDEIEDELKQYFDYIKCGRYLPELSTKNNCQYGVQLATSNQYIIKKGIDY